MNKGFLVYEDRPQVERWLKFLIACILGLTFILGLVFLKVDISASLVMFGVTLLDGLLFYFILPRSYQVYSDCLRIRLGGPFRVTIGYQKIKSVKKVDGLSAYAYIGIRLATNSKYVLEVARKNGMSVVISPSSGETFLTQLNQQIEASGKWP